MSSDRMKGTLHIPLPMQAVLFRFVHSNNLNVSQHLAVNRHSTELSLSKNQQQIRGTINSGIPQDPGHCFLFLLTVSIQSA